MNLDWHKVEFLELDRNVEHRRFAYLVEQTCRELVRHYGTPGGFFSRPRYEKDGLKIEETDGVDGGGTRMWVLFHDELVAEWDSGSCLSLRLSAWLEPIVSFRDALERKMEEQRLVHLKSKFGR